MRGKNRCRNTQRRHIRYLDGAVLLIEVDGRDIDFILGQLDRFLEVRPVALALQLRVRDDSNRSIGTRAIDADELAPTVVDADKTELRIGRLGTEFHDQPGQEVGVPGTFRKMIDGVYSAIDMRADHAATARDENVATSARAPPT